jgi:hypothetical protein
MISLKRELPGNKKGTIVIAIAVTAFIVSIAIELGLDSSTSTVTPTIDAYAQLTVGNQPAAATANSVSYDRFTAQKTSVSNAGTLPIHETHQIVKVLPARDDNKIWVGTVSWASSKPVELELWHSYNTSIAADTEHGQPVTAPVGNKTIAFTLLKTDS